MFRSLGLRLLFVAFFLYLAPIAQAGDFSAPQVIERIDIVHHSHTDIGYTDHPMVTRIRQMQYLDIAIDAVLETKDLPESAKFYWTAEVGISVDDWWNSASPERRRKMIEAIKTGQLEIAALAMNQSPLMDADQWDLMVLKWLPEEVRKAADIKMAMQNDVNGCPRAGAVRLLANGVSNLWMSINSHNGGPPFPQPYAFWWKMPDGERMFVWLNTTYPEGFFFFHDFDWRRGPVPESTDTRFRGPREGEIFRTDEESLRKYHKHLCAKLIDLENRGYSYPSLPISFTNVWRMDNDPPFPPTSKFVEAWNKLGLKPEIRMTTATAAMKSLRETSGDRIPEYSGEFTDWWANGSASGPKEVAVSRHAKRLLRAASSPVFGPMSDSANEARERILRELTLFDEHTWGSADSVGLPHALDTLGQYNEKSRYAYLAHALAKLLLSQRVRTHIYPQDGGYYVVNTAPQPWSGWVEMPRTALRESVQALKDPKTGKIMPLEWRPGFSSMARARSPQDISPETDQGTVSDNIPNQIARFWVDHIPPETAMRLVPATLPEGFQNSTPSPFVKTDEFGWPMSLVWNDQPTEYLFEQSPGDFVSVEFANFGGRWTYMDLHHGRDKQRRSEELKEIRGVPVLGEAGTTKVETFDHVTRYTQSLEHPRLKWLTRTLDVYHDEQRARLTVRFHRISNEFPEWYYVGSSLAVPENVMPTTSCGDMPFVPFDDQLPNTCRDYYGIDGWINYRSGQWDRLWVSRDAPLVCFGGPQPIARLTEAPENMNRVYAMVFDNTWMTNFVCDEHGIMEFQFDLVMQKRDPASNPKVTADSVLSEAVLVIHPENTRELPHYQRHLHAP